LGVYDLTLYNIIERNASIHAERIGWVSDSEKITHLQFAKTVNRVANGLLKEGVEKGDRISVLAQNSMAYFYLYGASAQIGAIMLPINFRLSPEEIEYIIIDGAPKILFVGSEYIDTITSISSKLGGVRRFYTMDEETENFSSFRSLLENNEIESPCEVGTEDSFVIIHTAAVSGKPRGAVLSHRGLISANLQSMYTWQLTDKDCHLCMLPLFHVAALGTSLNIMHAGGKNVVLPRFDPDRALKHIQDDRVTIFIEFPPMLETLFERNKKLGCKLNSLRIVGGLDQPDTVKKFQELTGGTFWIAYGQSEVSGLVTYAPYFEKAGSAGLPGFISEVKIADETGNFLKPGEIGEIVVRGPMVFNGYWNLEEDTAYTFRDGWHHTGDLGHFDPDGYLWYSGRMPEKELIKPGGENVYPAEVEKAILEHPSIQEVCVIGVPDTRWGEAIKAICVLKQGENLCEAEIIKFVTSKIASYKKPKYMEFISQLPKTNEGLTDREKVKATYGQV
jgi:long-chain acyl-CoA synthetase